MKSLKKAFGANLKALRKSRKYTQEELAEMIDLSPRQLIRIENGDNFPSADTLGKISTLLNVNLGTLFDFKWNNDTINTKNNLQNEVIFKIIKENELFHIRKNFTNNLEFNIPNGGLTLDKVETFLFEIAKKYNKKIIVEFFENENTLCIKSFNPDTTIKDILSENDVLSEQYYQYIISNLEKIKATPNKLYYLKLAFDSLDDKQALRELKTLIKWMDLKI